MNCRFCTIIKERPPEEEILFEDEKTVVIIDRYRRTSAGSILLVLSKAHRSDILELSPSECGFLFGNVRLIASAMKRAFNCKAVRIWTAAGQAAGQSIFHCHVHLVPCNSFIDRLTAQFPGAYDFLLRLSGNERTDNQPNYSLVKTPTKFVMIDK